MNKEALKYWIPTGLFAVAMTGSGLMNLMRPPEIVATMAHLGFPAWFPLLLGSWKVIGAAVLVAPGLPRWKEWAMAGFTVAMTSATTAHIATGDPINTAVPPLVLLAIGLAGWAMRPDSRKLAG